MCNFVQLFRFRFIYVLRVEISFLFVVKFDDTKQLPNDSTRQQSAKSPEVTTKKNLSRMWCNLLILVPYAFSDFPRIFSFPAQVKIKDREANAIYFLFTCCIDVCCRSFFFLSHVDFKRIHEVSSGNTGLCNGAIKIRMLGKVARTKSLHSFMFCLHAASSGGSWWTLLLTHPNEETLSMDRSDRATVFSMFLCRDVHQSPYATT